MTKVDTPIESFDARLVNLWQRAAGGETIRFDAREKGAEGSSEFTAELKSFIAMRQRLESLRFQMKKRGDARGTEFYKAKCTVGMRPNAPNYGLLVLEPRDAAFSHLLDKAGASVPPLAAPSAPQHEPADSFLDDVGDDEEDD